MRLAEFKIKLLVYFAAKLLRWAGAPQQEPEWTWERAVDSKAAPPAPKTPDSSQKAPPEPWLRLTKKAPPEPWVDLLREKAPNLLSSLDAHLSIQAEEESIQPEEQEPVDNQQDETASIVASCESEISIEEIPSQKTRVNPLNFSVSTRASAWLKRLRFAAPRRQAVKAKAAYVPYGQRKQNSSHYVVTNQPDTQPSSNILLFAEVSSRSRVLETESVPATTNSTERQPPHFAIADSERVRSSVNKPEYLTTDRSLPENGLKIFGRRTQNRKRSSPPWIKNEGTFSRALRAYRSLRYFELGSQRRGNAGDENTDYQSHAEQYFSIAEESEVPTSEYLPKSRPIYPELDHGRFQHPQPDVSRVNFAAHATRSAVGQTNYVATTARGNVGEMQFRQPEFSSPSVSNETAYYQRGNVWPELPPAPLFEMSDELLRLEAETDDLRRLTEEQRGT